MTDDSSWGSSRGNAAPRWQFQVAQLLLSQRRLAKLAVAAGESIGLARVDIYFGSNSPEYPDSRGLTKRPAQDLEIR
jgi:hypothetical protein